MVDFIKSKEVFRNIDSQRTDHIDKSRGLSFHSIDKCSYLV